MPGPMIDTPRGKIIATKGGKAELSWNVNFQPKWAGRYTLAQKYLDSEILRLSEPYTPLQTGMLIKSGTLGTEIGSGLIVWVAIYARRNYYSPREPGRETGPLRGPFWFERMKKAHGKQLLVGAKQLAGNGVGA